MASRGAFEVLGEGSKESEGMDVDEDDLRGIDGGSERIAPESLENLSSAVLLYIQGLESELATAQKVKISFPFACLVVQYPNFLSIFLNFAC